MSLKGKREGEEELNRKTGSSTTGSQRAVYHSNKFRSLAVRNCNIVTTTLGHEDSHRSLFKSGNGIQRSGDGKLDNIWLWNDGKMIFCIGPEGKEVPFCKVHLHLLLHLGSYWLPWEDDLLWICGPNRIRSQTTPNPVTARKRETEEDKSKTDPWYLVTLLIIPFHSALILSCPFGSVKYNSWNGYTLIMKMSCTCAKKKKSHGLLRFL